MLRLRELSQPISSNIRTTQILRYNEVIRYINNEFIIGVFVKCSRERKAL